MSQTNYWLSLMTSHFISSKCSAISFEATEYGTMNTQTWALYLIIRPDNDSAIHSYEKSDISHSRDAIQRNKNRFLCPQVTTYKTWRRRINPAAKWLSFIQSHRLYRLPMRFLVSIAATITAWEMESGCTEPTQTQKVVPRIDVIAWTVLKSNSGAAHATSIVWFHRKREELFFKRGWHRSVLSILPSISCTNRPGARSAGSCA